MPHDSIGFDHPEGGDAADATTPAFLVNKEVQKG
jgi:hypothetical protein